MKKQPPKAREDGTMPEDVPYTMRLPDNRTVFVLVPGQWCGRDRSGELTFKPKAVQFLDRVQVMAMKMPKTPTPGFIRTLREALGMTQAQLGERVGVDKLTVYRWERGMMKPRPSAVKALERLRKQAGRKGIILDAA
jgi:DNA-binding transcriptional regulator YiaG